MLDEVSLGSIVYLGFRLRVVTTKQRYAALRSLGEVVKVGVIGLSLERKVVGGRLASYVLACLHLYDQLTC